MKTENPEILEEKVNVECPYCKKSLAIPTIYFGDLGCPHCAREFQVKSSMKKGNGDDEEYLEIIVSKDQSFWLGLFVPIMAPIIASILLFTGIHQPSSPDIMGLFCFMGSLALWPIIGFSIAFSSGTFVKSFRSGARTSAIIASVITFFVLMMVINLLSSGITN